MPKRNPALPDEVVRRELSILDPELFITPHQVAMVSALSVRTLEEMRASQSVGAHALPFYQQIEAGKKRASVFYKVGDVREWLKGRQRLINTTQANVASGKLPKPVTNVRRHICRFNSMPDWLARGDIEDEWLFDLATGEPVEFFQSMRGGPSEGPFVWLAQHDWIAQQATAARKRKNEREADVLRITIRRRKRSSGVKKPGPRDGI